MSTVTTSQPWQQKQLNQSGIRRLKIVDADLVDVVGSDLIPMQDCKIYEFVFPSDLSCTATVTRQTTESAAIFWAINISFDLPHMSDDMILWAAETDKIKWLLISEDYNGYSRCYGGLPEGLELRFQATGGARPAAANPMNFSFIGNQIVPFTTLSGYDDNDLFNLDGGFSSGFSGGFK